MWQDDEKYGPLMRVLFWPVEDCVHRLVRDGCLPEMAGAHDPNTGPLARTYGIYAPARWDLLTAAAKKILESRGWSKYQYDAFMYWYDRDPGDHLQMAITAEMLSANDSMILGTRYRIVLIALFVGRLQGMLDQARISGGPPLH